MNHKLSLLTLGIMSLAAATFVACGGDSSTNGGNGAAVSNADYEVENYEDLPQCTSKKEGETAYVLDEERAYVCKNRKWVLDDDAVEVIKSSSSGKTDSAASSSSSGGGSASLRKCAAEFDGKYMNYEGSTYKCYEGFWNPEKNPPEDTDVQVICLKTEDPNAPLYCYLDTAIWSSSSYEADPEDFTNRDPVEITGGSIEGVAQKGPYLQGSSYRIIPLDGKTLKPVGDTLSESFNNSNGTYVFCDLEMPSQFAMIEASGYYRSELTGGKSNLQMTIGAIVDVQKGANINMLTNLEYERVKYLVQNEGYNIAGAKKRALTEVLAAFHIDADAALDAGGNKLSAEQLDITKDGAANGALLAISIMIQGALTNTEFDVKAMMKDFREDIKEDGAWTGKTARTIIADFAFAADSARKFADYRKNVEGWELSREVPVFEQYMNDFWGSEYGIGKCSEDRFGTIKKNQNDASAHKGNYFLCDTLWYSTRYGDSGFESCTAKMKVYYWREIGEFERNTRNQVCNVEGLIIPGNIDKEKYYICEKEKEYPYNLNWRKADSLEVDMYYTECTTDGKLNKFSDGKNYVCDGDAFREASDLENALEKGCVGYLDNVEMTLKGASFTCENGSWINKDGSLVKFDDGKLYSFSDGKLVSATSLDSTLGKACVSYTVGETLEKKEVEKYECFSRTITTSAECISSGSWKVTVDSSYNANGCEISYGKLKDSRDGQTYKTVKIGDQVWMAENLNYDYYTGTYVNDEHPEFGRYYTWKAAKKACPEGWHLPDTTEWRTLYKTMGETPYAIQAKGFEEWPKAIDAYGFSALPAGDYYYGGFDSVGSKAYFWSATEDRSATEDSNDLANLWRLYASSASLNNLYKNNGFSVRCLQDS